MQNCILRPWRESHSTAPNIIIKSEQHAARHLEGTNLTVEAAERAIRSDILSKGINETSKLKDGTINVGTYFVK